MKQLAQRRAAAAARRVLINELQKCWSTSDWARPAACACLSALCPTGHEQVVSVISSNSQQGSKVFPQLLTNKPLKQIIAERANQIRKTWWWNPPRAELTDRLQTFYAFQCHYSRVHLGKSKSSTQRPHPDKINCRPVQRGVERWEHLHSTSADTSVPHGPQMMFLLQKK